MKWSRTFEVVLCQQQRYPQAKALSSYAKGAWPTYSTEELQQKIDHYSRALWQMGVRPGEKLIIVPDLTSEQWLLLDLAIQQLGAAVVPFHWSSQPSHFEAIVEETEARFCFFGDEASRDRLWTAASPNVKTVVLTKGEFSLALDLESTQLDLEAIKASVKSDELCCIIYTSGTTGRPKGVMLSHDNIVSNIKSVLPLLPLEPGERVLSFLPFSHIFERTILYAYLAMGMSVHLAEDREELVNIFQKVRPHYFSAVPRILERMYDNVLAHQLQQGWYKRRIMRWALKLGTNYREAVKLRPWYWFQQELAKMLVFNRFRHQLGGKVKAIFSGAAYLDPKLSRLFAAAGIKVREGYGMSETAPILTFNQFSPGLYRFGTVGVPIPGVVVVIDRPDENGQGEILVKGPNVMKGYFKQPEETEKVFTPEGWLRTGDVGKFVKNRFLQITDRKKDIFKTSSGKYVSPLVLENHFRQSEYIEQIMILGFKRPHVTALIKPNFEQLQLWCMEQEIHWTGPQYMLHNIKVIQKIQEEIDPLNESLSKHEQLRGFHLFHEEWTPESGHLSYTMKLLRPKIVNDFTKQIEAMYQA
ncbi:MAG: long-chain fatty acid--CoA ligase [Bacteroidota bacterium]